ncbi:thioesterase family protein [Natrialba sp. PRR66]|uniref:acyl-CoA thioesterase n=1 Tax=Natrialba sp. PRR66 TaxID=3098146 RepID=UPI002B1D9AD5|nr:thioesterase family protein [Natrialba sp. PRR66]
MTPGTEPDTATDTYVVDIDVRLRDIDFMGHVNNATYATYLEQAREAYFQDVFDTSLADIDTVLAHLEIDYKQPIEADAAVSIALSVGELGTASLPLTYEIYADESLAATATTVQVFIDPGTGDSRPIPEAWRSQLD